MSLRKRHVSAWKDSSPTENLEPLAPLSPLSFPKFHELVNPKTFEVARETGPAVSSQPQGLFNGLLRDDFTVLYQDATENPGKYDEQTLGLLMQLVQGATKVRELTESERRLLDKATIDFASYVPPKPPPRKEPPAPTRASSDKTPVSAPPIPGIDVPETDTPAYWWLQ